MQKKKSKKHSKNSNINNKKISSSQKKKLNQNIDVNNTVEEMVTDDNNVIDKKTTINAKNDSIENSENENFDEINDENEYISFRSIFKPLIKLLTVPLLIILVAIGFFTGFQIYSNSLETHFIAPSKEDMYGQKEDMYIISTYYQYDVNSISFIKELKKTAKENNIGYYFVDIEEYPGVVELWQIRKTPSYYLIDKAAEDIVYASYGRKNHEALTSEVKNVVKYGMPQNDVTNSEQIDSLEVTLKEIKRSDSDNHRYSVKFEFKNSSSSAITIKSENFHAYYNGFKGETKKDEYKVLNSSNTVTIAANSTETFELNYYVAEDNFKVKFILTINDKTCEWNYKLWPVTKR